MSWIGECPRCGSTVKISWWQVLRQRTWRGARVLYGLVDLLVLRSGSAGAEGVDVGAPLTILCASCGYRVTAGPSSGASG